MAEGQEEDREGINKSDEAVGIIIFKDDKVLVVRNVAGTFPGEGVYSLPGGKKIKTNQKETDKKTAVGKLLQETGLNTTPESLEEFDGNYFEEEYEENGFAKKISWRVFLCTNFSGELKEDEPHEANPRWVDLKVFNKPYETASNTSGVILNAQRHLSQQKAATSS